MQRDPDAAAVLFAVHAAYSNRVSGMRTLRDETRRLRAALEAEPGVRPARDTPGSTPNAAD